MLEVRNLEVRYGAILAVRGVDLTIDTGEIVALIGGNGAGKSTITRAIAGLLPYRGDILYEGKSLRGVRAEDVVRAGITLVPEGRGILVRMSVRENLLMGTYCRRDQAAAHAQIADILERFPILAERQHVLASLLSGGEQQMLSIARALLTKPRLLMLDEPSLGLAPKWIAQVFALLGELRKQGVTILLVEQKARQALRIADRAYLLETGRVVASGAAAALAQDSVVSETFLGGHPMQRNGAGL
jgi:branched-chain amino acid transport system ATP-binding protein